MYKSRLERAASTTSAISLEGRPARRPPATLNRLRVDRGVGKPGPTFGGWVSRNSAGTGIARLGVGRTSASPAPLDANNMFHSVERRRSHRIRACGRRFRCLISGDPVRTWGPFLRVAPQDLCMMSTMGFARGRPEVRSTAYSGTKGGLLRAQIWTMFRPRGHELRTGKTEHPPNPSLDRPFSGPNPVDRTSGRGRPHLRHVGLPPRHAQGRRPSRVARTMLFCRCALRCSVCLAMQCLGPRLPEIE